MSRRQSREIALQILFQKEFAPDATARELVENFVASFGIDPNVGQYTTEVISGLSAHWEAVDKALSAASRNWNLHRMALVDLNILRIACFEILWMQPPVPAKVAINEAIELAKKYGSSESPAFINGILDQVSRQNQA